MTPARRRGWAGVGDGDQADEGRRRRPEAAAGAAGPLQATNKNRMSASKRVSKTPLVCSADAPAPLVGRAALTMSMPAGDYSWHMAAAGAEAAPEVTRVAVQEREAETDVTVPANARAPAQNKGAGVGRPQRFEFLFVCFGFFSADVSRTRLVHKNGACSGRPLRKISGKIAPCG